MVKTIQNYDVTAKRSSAGLGLFAEEHIDKDECIIEYTGEIISREESDRRGGKYMFEIDE
jgi:SET domain-containing protein